MKKILVVISFLSMSGLFSQVAAIDIFFLKDGMEDEYLELEQVWSEFHKQMIADGKMYGWSLFKFESISNSDGDVPHYMTLNRYESLEAMKSAYEGITPEIFNKILKKRLKGKFTSRQIKNILETDPKKMHHSYTIELTGQTMPSVEMEIGELINVDAMVQNVVDYEKFEINWAMPIFQDNVENGNLKWWGFTKVVNRNDEALDEITHFTWRIPVDGKDMNWNSKKYKDMFGGEFTFNKLVGMVQDSRTILGNAQLKLINAVK